jgi:hypothetical protein
MQAEYMQTQPSVEVEALNGMATVIMRVPAEPTERDGSAVYNYEEYYIPAVYRDNLKADVETNFSAWLALATKESAPQPTIEQRVEVVESEVASVAEVVNVLFGGMA